jgi:hypothetical protein
MNLLDAGRYRDEQFTFTVTASGARCFCCKRDV